MQKRDQGWRVRQPGDTLPDKTGRTGPDIKGTERCGALGLDKGDCDMPRLRRGDQPSVYCYYHNKLELGLSFPYAETFGLPVSDFYPAWPLPVNGYVITKQRKAS